MKFNVEVEIEWLGEDDSIDSVVKKRIVDAVVKRISDDTLNSIANETEKIIKQKIDSLVTKTYETFLEKGVTITDEWGDAVQKEVKIIDLIKNKAGKWLQ